MEDVTLTIDGVSVTVPQGTTLLKAAAAIGVEIPAICYHEATTPNALCRMCVVEIQGSRVLVPSCNTRAAQGMVVQTSSERVQRARRTILEMLASSVDLSEAPEIQQMMADHHADPARFPDATARVHPVLDDNPMYVRDYSKCILCWRCVQVCGEDAQYTFAINFSDRGYDTQIGTFFNRPIPATTCVLCGQCVGVCPTGALKPKREWLFEKGLSAEDVFSSTHTEPRRRRRAGGERRPE